MRYSVRHWTWAVLLAASLACGGPEDPVWEPEADDPGEGGAGGGRATAGRGGAGGGGAAGAAVGGGATGAGGSPSDARAGGARDDASFVDAGVVDASALDVASADAASGAADSGMPRGRPVFVAVGYAGRRIRSRDLGMTWENDQTLGGGGDDQYLLRAVTWGDGVFVATGWKILSSPDGATWTEHRNPRNQWLGGVQYGSGVFAAVGGYGYSAFSMNGKDWMAGGGRGNEAARSLAFGNGTFTGATDPGNWWSSTDGRAWTRGTGGHSSRVVYCGDGFKDAAQCAGPMGRNGGRVAFGGGVHVSVRGGTIERSTDGKTWTTVRSGGAAFEGVAFGFVP